jgi:hypothetical protein
MLLSASVVRSTLDAATIPADVDAAVSAMLDENGAPDYIAVSSWQWVEITGHGHALRILVCPDCAALGPDDQPYRLSRMTPYGAQAYADRLDAILPSRKLLLDAQRASSPIIPFIDVKAHGIPLSQIETPEAADLASDLAASAYSSRDLTPGDVLTVGYKKSIVTGPNLDGSRVAICGGVYSNGALVQPYATPHSSSYSDYSHGVTLVSRKAVLDGSPVDLRTDVFGSSDPNVVALVNDQGVRFDPVFPNAGSGSRAEFGGGGVTPAPSGGTTSKGGGKAAAPKSSGGGLLAGAAKLGLAVGVGFAVVRMF